MGAHRGNRAAGLYGGLRVKKDIDVSGDVNVDGVVTASGLDVANFSAMQVVKIGLAFETGGGGAFSWDVPFDCIVGPVALHVITAPSAARTINVGLGTAANQDRDTFFDGLSSGTANSRVFNTTKTTGTNERGFWVATDANYVTGTWSSAPTGSPEMNIYIYYTPTG